MAKCYSAGPISADSPQKKSHSPKDLVLKRRELNLEPFEHFSTFSMNGLDENMEKSLELAYQLMLTPNVEDTTWDETKKIILSENNVNRVIGKYQILRVHQFSWNRILLKILMECS